MSGGGLKQSSMTWTGRGGEEVKNHWTKDTLDTATQILAIHR